MSRTDHIRELIDRNEILRPYHETLFPKGCSRKRFLDLSCGTRTDIREIVENFGHEWVGVDQIDLSGVIKADVHHLPFTDGEFDIVFSAATFEHYYDPWQVAREVKRVLKPGGIFCGLIAFIQPWHADSYYHFTHLGTQQMLKGIDFEILDIHAGDYHGVAYLIETMFATPVPVIGKALSLCGLALAKLRQIGFPLIVNLLYARNPVERQKKTSFLKDDDLRYAASIIFLSRKAIVS